MHTGLGWGLCRNAEGWNVDTDYGPNAECGWALCRTGAMPIGPIGADSMGAMGAIAPRPKGCGGDAQELSFPGTFAPFAHYK